MAESHGHSTAAWTGVTILLIATALICLGIVFALEWLWIAGIIGLVIGAAAWIVLAKAGQGGPSPTDQTDTDETQAAR